MRDDDNSSQPVLSSPTSTASSFGYMLEELQLYGHHPFDDQPDPRPLPEEHRITAAMADIFDAMVSTFSDTRMENDLETLLWSTVNLFHSAMNRIARQLDTNEQHQRSSQAEQDGSEVKSVELERLIAEGITLTERRNCMEVLRDLAAEHFEHQTGSHWLPRSGSKIGNRNLTAAMIDSRDYIAAKRLAETEPLLPPGPKVAFSGGDTADHSQIWAKLDQVLAKHPDMVLLHGGSPKGSEKAASCWATTRNIPQIAFKPDWKAHSKAAPFRRNDLILATMPIGIIIFPGTGIQENLADKARKLGIPVYRLG